MRLWSIFGGVMIGYTAAAAFAATSLALVFRCRTWKLRFREADEHRKKLCDLVRSLQHETPRRSEAVHPITTAGPAWRERY